MTVVSQQELSPEELENLQAHIARLEKENAELRKAKSSPELELPMVEDYNPADLLSLKDTAELQEVVTRVDNLSFSDMHTLVRLSGLKPKAQYRPATRTRGRGENLYSKEELVALLFNAGAC